MKRYIAALGLVTVLGCSGCATGPIIGPLSMMAVSANKQDATERAIYRAKAPVAVRQAALGKLRVGVEPVEAIQDVPGVDGIQYTWIEKLLPLLGAVGDAALYGGAAYGISSAVGSGGGGGGDTTTVTQGNDSQYNISTVNGNGTSNSGGGGRQDSGQGSLGNVSRRAR